MGHQRLCHQHHPIKWDTSDHVRNIIRSLTYIIYYYAVDITLTNIQKPNYPCTSTTNHFTSHPQTTPTSTTTDSHLVTPHVFFNIHRTDSCWWWCNNTRCHQINNIPITSDISRRSNASGSRIDPSWVNS